MDLKKPVICLGFISIVLILGISFLTWKWVDDFRFEKFLQTKGVFEFMWYLFTHWDGRFLSFVSFLQLSLIKYLNHDFVIFIYSLFFISNSILIFRTIFDELNLKTKLKMHNFLYIIPICSISLFYGFYKHISETVYWEVGGIYMVHVFLGLLWIIGYNKIIKKNQKILIIVCFSLFSIMTGMLTQNLVVCLLMFILIESILFFYHKEKRKLLFLILFAVCLIIGISITSFSTGTLFRISSSANSIEINPINYIRNYFHIFKVFFKASVLLIPFSVFSAISIFILLRVKLNEQVKEESNRIIRFIVYFKWFLIGISSVSVLAFIPDRADFRTSLFFMIFLYIFIVLFCFNALSKIRRINFFINQRIISICLLILFSGHLIYMSYCFKIGYEFKTYMIKVDRNLRAHKDIESSIVVKNIALRSYPFVYNIRKWELSNNPDADINKEWSFYYGIKSIKSE